MAFRTDPRFETYNSSGYVYKKSTNTLLLKSRHKAAFEVIRLVYRQAAPSPKIEKKPEPVVEEKKIEAPVQTPAAVSEAEDESETEEEDED